MRRGLLVIGCYQGSWCACWGLGAVGAPAQPAPVAGPRSRTGRHQPADPGRGPVDRHALGLESLSGVGSVLSKSFEFDLPLGEVLRLIGTGHEAPERKGTNGRIASLRTHVVDVGCAELSSFATKSVSGSVWIVVSELLGYYRVVI